MKKRTLVLFIGIAIVSTTAVIMTTTQSQTRQHIDDTPTVDFDTANRPSSQDPLRTARGRKYKSQIPLDKMADQVNVFEIPGAHSSAEPAFPIEQSSSIILGTVTDSRAFVSNDKTAVYSEFDIRVNQSFKNRGTSSESQIVAERVGGIVRFASGRVQRRGDSGRSLPQKGKQYILFLKWDEAGEDYLIITGYEVDGATIYPLDGFEKGTAPIFSNYTRYRGARYDEFLADLKKELAKSSHGGDQ